MKHRLDSLTSIGAQLARDRCHQQLLKSVATGFLQRRVVMVEPKYGAIIGHAHEQRAALAVHVPSKRFHYDVLQGAINVSFAQVPAKRRLELQSSALALSNGAAHVVVQRRAQLPDLLRPPSHGDVDTCSTQTEHDTDDCVKRKLLGFVSL